jgi:hypothetical protein
MSFESDRRRRLEALLAHANRSRAVTHELLTEAIANACMRFHAHGHTTKTAFNQHRRRSNRCRAATSSEPEPNAGRRSKLPIARSSGLPCALDLSKSRANDTVLDILKAYKLTGNFHVNLEIVLKDIGAFDKVTYQIEHNPKLPYSPDCRHVVFKPNENIHADMFGEIIKSIEARIGFEAPWWLQAASLARLKATRCL